jgi:signal transduction histidine kinase/DNA-binding response OmpR family regulator/CHASE3 domain sensor protein
LSGRETQSKAGSASRAEAMQTLGFAAVVLFFVVSGVLSYRNLQVLARDSQLVVKTHQVITGFGDVLSTMKDAETGQRGFVITGNPEYLEPYEGAAARLEERLNTLEQLTKDNPSARARIPAMREHVDAKMKELAATIVIRRAEGFEAARRRILTDQGKTEMDVIRSQVELSQREEQARRSLRLEEMEQAQRTAIATGILSAILGVLLAVLVSQLVRRANRLRRHQEWLQTGQVAVGGAMFGDQQVERLGENVLHSLAEYLGAHAGAFFVKEGDAYRRVATFGLPTENQTPLRFAAGESLLGQVAKDNQIILIHDVPQGYLSIGSALGQGDPRQILIAPAVADGAVNAVFELGFVHSPPPSTNELLDVVADPIGVAVRSALDRSRVQALLEETQRQSEELQTQSEELRVSNEELEEQGRALRDSQARLEQQQLELEQTNVQLEEQTQQLELQRDSLNRSKLDLEAQAKDLERVSRFKSDFLANMSHELRTPLNSSLILAKLLADNREGNLTDEQIKYAQTIQSAGNDLLALISDILDLSKIEAGHMEAHVESLSVEALLASLRRTFEPVAGQKGLALETRLEASAPATIETDPQRLEQILKNLLSNAIKFTERGRVAIEVRPAPGDRIAFSVVDTGIGIPEHQQAMVFEAFRQADGTTNRKYGGTGLGLSISRELANLLGGQVSLHSEAGKGSTFTVTLPIVLSGPNAQPVITEAPVPPIVNRPAPAAPIALPASAPSNDLDDDRDRLNGSGRLILVVEDDRTFARLLYDLAHEQRFQCLLATNASDGLALALEYRPSAVLLDIGLPDNSGLSVLDRLKHDDRTRHIPVHVVSGADYANTAKALGAVGYMLKPVKREQLVQAFEELEERLTQRLRRVLVVEDDPVQLDSLRLLLSSSEVETVGARTAAECLSLLSTTTFDCMVLDLSLPDASGFSLLETLSQEEAYAFPPVIVYTGRELGSEEEQRLRRYSKSIIVKGAKSPERLLDEVTLFLHQVVADLPAEKQRLLEKAKRRDADLEERRILVVEDDIRNVFALTSILEPRGAKVEIARNGREALDHLARTMSDPGRSIDLVLMDIMMPEMDGFTAMREIRKNPEWRKLPIIALTAKAMKNDQEECLAAGANDYMAKPLDVEKLLSLVRVWMPRD